MPKNAQVFLVEDYEPIRATAKHFLEKEGHEVRVEAGTLEEALERVETVKQEGVNVAVLDKSLGSGRDDGSEIAAALRAEIEGIKIISFSMSEKLKWADKSIAKPEIEELVEAVTNI